MHSALIKLVTLQFAVYAVFGMLGFVAWTIVFSSNASVVEMIAGKYISGHLARWTEQFLLWGVFVLLSSILSFCAAWLLRSSRREGGYFGIVSFSVGFVTNIIFARNVLVHGLIGSLAGWTLLAPLAVAWKDLE